MKSGTAQKLVLNMLSTSLMIKLGHVKVSLRKFREVFLFTDLVVS